MNKYDWFFIAGLVLWLVETWAFGWNEEAGSVAEKVLDGISVFLMVYGGFGGLGSAIKTDLHIHTDGNLDIRDKK